MTRKIGVPWTPELPLDSLMSDVTPKFLGELEAWLGQQFFKKFNELKTGDVSKNRGFYDGVTTIAANSTTALEWVHEEVGTPLNLSGSTTEPTAVLSGIYNVTINVNAHAVSGVALPVGAAFEAKLQIDSGAIGGFQGVTYGMWEQPDTTQDVLGHLSLSWFCPAGGIVSVLVTNLDSSPHDFNLAASVQQIGNISPP